MLRASGEVGWTGAVLAMWAVASLVGGFAYGAVSRSFSPLTLMAALSLCTIPVGLGGAHWWLLCLTLVPAGALCAPTIAATSDAVSRLAPAGVRGEAMGLHGSAVTVGIALGAPLAGAVIDASLPLWGFAVTGAIACWWHWWCCPWNCATAARPSRPPRNPSWPPPPSERPAARPAGRGRRRLSPHRASSEGLPPRPEPARVVDPGSAPAEGHARLRTLYRCTTTR